MRPPRPQDVKASFKKEFGANELGLQRTLRILYREVVLSKSRDRFDRAGERRIGQDDVDSICRLARGSQPILGGLGGLCRPP
jgi:hypothetical protein